MDQYDLYYERYLETWEKVRPTLRSHYNLYDYNLSALSDEYFQLFKFAYDNIHSEWKKYGLGDCYFFFNDSDDVQAKAIQPSRAITIYKGLIDELAHFFRQYDNALGDGTITVQPAFYDHLRSSITAIMQTNTLLFSYYHELAHIVQITHNGERVYTENNNSIPTKHFNILDHVDELDADEFAANFLFDHILEQWKSLPPLFQNQDSFEKFLADMLAGIYLLFYVLAGKRNVQIYYDQKEHPHNYLRIVKITGIFLTRAKTVRSIRRMRMDENQILALCFEVVRNTINETEFDHFRNTLRDEQHRFAEYFDKLATESRTKSYLAGKKISAYQQRAMKNRVLKFLLWVVAVVILILLTIYILSPQLSLKSDEKEVEIDYPVMNCIKKPNGLDPSEYVQVKALFSSTDIKAFEIHLFAFDEKNYSYNCLNPGSGGKVVETFVKIDKIRSAYQIHVITSSVSKNATLDVKIDVLGIKGDTLGKFKGSIKTPLITKTYELDSSIKIQRSTNENPPVTSASSNTGHGKRH